MNNFSNTFTMPKLFSLRLLRMGEPKLWTVGPLHYNGGIRERELAMYVASDYFLSDEATVEVSRGEHVTSDVHILVRDANGAFQISAYMSYAEAQDLVGTYYSASTHSSLSFDGFRVYALHGDKMDELKFTLEMM